MNIQINKEFKTSNLHNQKRTFPGHIIVKFSNIKNKEGILKAIREKDQVIYISKPIRITVTFST